MPVSKLEAPDVPHEALSVDEALAQMKTQVSERFAAWPHRTQAMAAVRYVADYFDLPMGDRAVRRAAFGLMENDYDAERLRRAKRRLLVDPEFARKRRDDGANSVVVEAADFERALRGEQHPASARATTRAAASRLQDERPVANGSAPPARN